MRQLTNFMFALSQKVGIRVTCVSLKLKHLCVIFHESMVMIRRILVFTSYTSFCKIFKIVMWEHEWYVHLNTAPAGWLQRDKAWKGRPAKRPLTKRLPGLFVRTKDAFCQHNRQPVFFFRPSPKPNNSQGFQGFQGHLVADPNKCLPTLLISSTKATSVVSNSTRQIAPMLNTF